MPSKRIGRPTLYDTQADARISLNVTPAQLAELKLVARENRTTVSGIIREAVNEFVADYDERRPFAPRRR